MAYFISSREKIMALNYLRQVLEAVRFAATEAGSHILEELRKADGHFEVQEKERPNDLVTVVDRSAQELIKSTLLTDYPHFAFYGEEGWKSGDRIDSNVPTWIVDPIDGTSNFEHGIPLFCVSIALVLGGEVLVAVVLELPSKRLFHAIRGEGAFLGGKKLEVRNLLTLSRGLVGFAFANVRDKWQSQVVSRVTTSLVEEGTKLRNFGSGTLALCYVASNGLDGFFNCRIFDWDVAAAALIIQEAGGLLLDENGNPWQPHGEPHGVVAVGGGAALTLQRLFLDNVAVAKGAN